ncbi:hypothetical protein F4678DRAFT_465335 [Xylaria arbuscula]|nr:hypothetical protein F4678DRAFT_465335 [Xylaria arbuscula]
MSQLQAPTTGLYQPNFPQFVDLPPELRLEVWKAAFNGEDRGVHLFGFPPKRPKFFDVPVWFFVNWECREEAKKYYTAVKVQITVDGK